MTDLRMTGPIPKHVAIIMDGNGRWAKQKRLPRTRGHVEGIKRIEEMIEAAGKMGVKVLTLYAFSTENWTRPKQEVNMLMRALISVLQKKIKKLDQEDIQLRFIGRRNDIAPRVLEAIESAERLTAKNKTLIVNVAFSYGSRQEIVDAVRKIARDVKDGKINVQEIDEHTLSDALYTKGQPDPDLLIRTSGELRVSNFLLWQLSYAELYFTDTYWPDFKEKNFRKAIADFQVRERRYGAIKVTGS
ncbi:MAG: isoprenyl transferase [Candidatus Omnitrophota bacterium]